MVVYTLALRVYGVLLRLASLWHPKARLWVRGRRNWASRLALQLSGDARPVVWFHCASLGEFEQGRPIMEEFLALHPGHRLVVSFFSPSGYTVRQGYARASAVCYLPLDSRRNARRFLQIVRPTHAFFVKYELWYHFLRALQAQGVPTYLVSAHFVPTHAFFKWYGRWYRSWLELFTHIYVQDESSLALLSGVGIERVSVAGDTRFDRVHAAVLDARGDGTVARFAEGARVLVAGSTWPVDETALLEVAAQMPPGWKFILVPHEIHSGRIRAWVESLRRLHGTVRPLIYSEASYTPDIGRCDVLVVDTVGLLLGIYQHAALAYVGGGFGVGIHNTLEPAAYGVGVVFGPNHHRFREAEGLLEAGGGLAVGTPAQLTEVLLGLLRDPERLEEMGQAARQFVGERVGATERILRGIDAEARRAV